MALWAVTASLYNKINQTCDALGSFNSWLRLLTGVLFSLGAVWALFPHLHAALAVAAREIEDKFTRAGLPL
jgi:hypothetical protein